MVEICVIYRLKNGSSRHKTFIDIKKAFNFWMDKPDGIATIKPIMENFSYTHNMHFGLLNRENIYNRFVEAIKGDDYDSVLDVPEYERV